MHISAAGNHECNISAVGNHGCNILAEGNPEFTVSAAGNHECNISDARNHDCTIKRRLNIICKISSCLCNPVYIFVYINSLTLIFYNTILVNMVLIVFNQKSFVTRWLSKGGHIFLELYEALTRSPAC